MGKSTCFTLHAQLSDNSTPTSPHGVEFESICFKLFSGGRKKEEEAENSTRWINQIQLVNHTTYFQRCAQKVHTHIHTPCHAYVILYSKILKRKVSTLKTYRFVLVLLLFKTWNSQLPILFCRNTTTVRSNCFNKKSVQQCSNEKSYSSVSILSQTKRII